MKIKVTQNEVGGIHVAVEYTHVIMTAVNL